LLQQYIYIDRLLDSTLPRNLLDEYNKTSGSSAAANRENIDVSASILEEASTPSFGLVGAAQKINDSGPFGTKKVKRTPRELYRVPTEETPLFAQEDGDDYDGPKLEVAFWAVFLATTNRLSKFSEQLIPP
jgi:hypothetical protein